MLPPLVLVELQAMQALALVKELLTPTAKHHKTPSQSPYLDTLDSNCPYLHIFGPVWETSLPSPRRALLHE